MLSRLPKDTATQATKEAYASIRKYIVDRYARFSLMHLRKSLNQKGNDLLSKRNSKKQARKLIHLSRILLRASSRR